MSRHKILWFGSDISRSVFMACVHLTNIVFFFFFFLEIYLFRVVRCLQMEGKCKPMHAVACLEREKLRITRQHNCMEAQLPFKGMSAKLGKGISYCFHRPMVPVMTLEQQKSLPLSEPIMVEADGSSQPSLWETVHCSMP